ncbi:hypothetical protein INT48_008674 [Thamnidium elegans]|uniref:Uncharacterized protein n=1 Tax=Thamnidium elegans TaxID=101142 RepID=A0A8H7SNP6_9FUNG|nr:hypothetical protein INT48_008674 [Thamnidium elegans]
MEHPDPFDEKKEAEAESQATAIFNPHKDLSRFETAQDGYIYKLFDIYRGEATELSNVGLMKFYRLQIFDVSTQSAQ